MFSGAPGPFFSHTPPPPPNSGLSKFRAESCPWSPVVVLTSCPPGWRGCGVQRARRGASSGRGEAPRGRRRAAVPAARLRSSIRLGGQPLGRLLS